MNNENTNQNQTIFVEGMYSNEVSEKAPEWLLGSLSIQPEKLAMWLQANLALKNEKGYINLIVKRSKTTGKRFISVDTYKKPSPAPAPQPNTEAEYTLADLYPEQEPLNFENIN